MVYIHVNFVLELGDLTIRIDHFVRGTCLRQQFHRIDTDSLCTNSKLFPSGTQHTKTQLSDKQNIYKSDHPDIESIFQYLIRRRCVMDRKKQNHAKEMYFPQLHSKATSLPQVDVQKEVSLKTSHKS